MLPTDSPPPPPEIWRHPPAGRVLVLAPHPDDETLGCGGIIALHRAQGDPVRVVFLTDGAAGDPAGYYPAERYVAIRQREARRAGVVLGAEDLAFWGLPDGKLSSVPDLEHRVAAGIRAFQPDVLYYPSSAEVHPDHWAAGAAVEALGRAGRLVCAAYAYEVWAAIRPTHLIDITSVLSVKQAAMAEYPSQLRYHDYRPRILGLNAYRALLLGPGPVHAEAFQRLA
jgi:LmbE family N-acetylglucosaminyl deacetylase